MSKKVLVGGVFNIIHPGHVWFLKKAKSYGSYLIVVVAHDERAKKKHLLFPATERKKVLESLKFVDKVVIGDKDDMFSIVKKEKPDVIVLGYDQNIDKKKINSIDKKIRIIKIKKKFGEYSTRKLIITN